MVTIPDLNSDVSQAYEAFAPSIRPNLLALRQLIFETADTTKGVGPLTETLKWGEPAYLTEHTKSGSTIRLGWKAASPTRYAMYFNCRTNLVDTFHILFPVELKFEGNRAIIFDKSESLAKKPLSACIAMALTYHLNKKL